MSYYTQLIPDFGLSADQLKQRYGVEDYLDDGSKGHPVFTVWDWVQVVAQRATKSGYWEWVQHQLYDAQDELDLDNPYSQENR